MTKTEYIELLMLLSALESWGFSNKTQIPDYLHERLGESVELLKKMILEEK